MGLSLLVHCDRCCSTFSAATKRRQSLLINMASVPKRGSDGPEKKEAEDEEGKVKGCLSEARHAIAKTLVTTNPNLLTEAQTMG